MTDSIHEDYKFGRSLVSNWEIQLDNQYTPLSDTKLPQGRGVHDPKTHAVSHLFARPKEDDLDVSFNTQSHTSDIPGISTTEELLDSFNVQGQVPDDPSYVQNTQCTPRDLFSSSPPFSQVFSRLTTPFSTETRQMSFDFSSSAHQIPVRTQTTSPQAYSRKEFDDHLWEVLSSHDEVNWNHKSPYQGFWYSEVHVRRLRIRIVSDCVVCVHSVDLDS